MRSLRSILHRIQAWFQRQPLWFDVGILLLLAILALLPRLYRLNSAPAGLGGDELFNAIDALRLGPANWQIYFASNNGREALFNYLMALSLNLFGQQVWAVRLPAVFLGLGSVLLTYGIGRNEFNRRVGLFAGSIMSVSLWPVMQSRWGLRAVSLTFFTALTVYLFGRALRAKGHAWLLWLAAGVALGLSMYTYIPSRIFPVVILGWLIWIAINDSGSIKQKWPGIVVSLFVGLLIFAPYGLYMIQNPETVNQRLQAFSSVPEKLQRGEISALWIPIRATVEMFFIRGDDDLRYYMVGRPIFDLVTAVIFLIGLAHVIWRAFSHPHGEDRRANFGLLLLWSGIMLVPGAVVGLGNFTLRASGAIVPTYLILAHGFESLYLWLKSKFPEHKPLLRLVYTSLFILALFLTLLGTWRSYFGNWINATEVRNIYHIALAEMGRYLNEHPPPEGTEVFIAYDYVSDTTPQSFAYYSDQTPTWFDNDSSFGWRPTTNEIWYLQPANRPIHSLALDRLRASSVNEAFYFDNGDRSFTIYRITPSELSWEPRYAAEQQFVDGPKLVGYDIPEEIYRGDMVTLTLHWLIPEGLPLLPNRLIFAKALILDESGNAWGQAEKLMGYPEAGWQSGDRFTTFLDIEIPKGMPPGPFYLQIGLRDWNGHEINLVEDGPKPLGPMIARSRPLEDITVSAETPVFGDVLALQDHNLSTLLQPGIPIDLALDWLAIKQPAIDYKIRLSLKQVGGSEPFLEQEFELWPEVYPPSQWQAGEQVTTFHRLNIPLDIPTESNAELTAELLQPDSNEPVPIKQGSPVLAELTPKTREHIFDPPDIERTIEADFGSQIRLLGYDLDNTKVKTGDNLGLTLYWQAIETPSDAYTVFNHILGLDGQMQGQLDSPPVSDGWLTTTWLPGEIIMDRRIIPIRPDAALGENELIVGLYTSSDVKRLPVTVNGQTQANDQLKLTTITIEPG